jgi:hypothetical protein
MSTIEIRDIGPVEHVSIPIPEEGGVVVLRGRNGAGKSNTLEAVESLTTGKGKLAVRDGALRGEVSGCGATITVGRATRRTGELEVVTLEGKLSIAELVDPGLKNDAAADAKRIKALVSLTGTDADPSEFHKLLGGKEAFQAIVSPSSIEDADWVQMAEKIKRDIEREARKAEDAAEYADGKARGMIDAADEGDEPETMVDRSLLQQQLIEAVDALSRLQAEERASLDAQRRQDEAKAKLAACEFDVDAAMEEAVKERDVAIQVHGVFDEKLDDKLAEVDRLKILLHEAEEEAIRLASDRDTAWKAVNDAEKRVQAIVAQSQSMKQLRDAVTQTVPYVDREEIENADALVTQLTDQLQQAAVHAEKAKQRQQARDVKQQALQHRKRAAELRNAAQSTDEVLSALVAKSCQLLRVEHGRLVLDTHRGTTYFAELSHGERWKLAIDVALEQLGNRGVIVIPQEAWEGCDEFARAAISEHAKERGVVILTAECSVEEAIIASEYEGDGPVGLG